MELCQHLERQRLDKELVRYGWMTLDVLEMRNPYHSAVTKDGELRTVGMAKMLVWYADPKVSNNTSTLYYHL